MRTRAPFKTWICSLIVGACLSVGCGKNIFQEYEKEDPAQESANAMERGESQKAIDILEPAIEKDPDNYVLISLLSAAYAQKHEVDILDLALAMADGDDEDSGTKTSGIAVLWPFLPEASAANMNGLSTAVELLESIPVPERTSADNFKLAILSTASVSLRAKSFDTNGDGQLSTQELLAMGEDDATAIIEGILAASSVLSSGSEIGENSDKAASRITSISDAITGQEGETDAEKLANYFASEQE